MPYSRISVIITCYNLGEYVKEALESIFASTYQPYEIILVDDGSTDITTQKIIEELKSDSRLVVIQQDNQGLAMARNNGISKCIGDYILPLDADNKIHKTFLQKAVEVLSSKSDIDVIYGDKLLFGARSEHINVDVFNKVKILWGNYIDACALINAKTLRENQICYDAQMPHQGWEDWDLWMQLTSINGVFHKISSLSFHYRVREDSMLHSAPLQQLENTKKYLASKHYDLIYNTIHECYNEIELLHNNPFKLFPRLVLRKLFPNNYQKFKSALKK